MNPGKIYYKIFLSFLLTLIVTEVLIFGLFGIIMGRHLRPQAERYASAQVMMMTEIIESKMRSPSSGESTRNDSLEGFLEELGEILGARIWLQQEDGEVVAKSFQGSLPREQEQLAQRQGKDFGRFRLYHGRRGGTIAYAVAPITLKGSEGVRLHVLFPRSGSSHPETGFALGLGIIGVVIALLVIPVSRFISKPINELRQSAERIAEGDLSHRVRVRGKDEIGNLGRTFNHMADNLERMIRGSKELAAHISHRLRTPLTRIRIAEEMLREKMALGNETNLARYLDNIREDIEELDLLIGRILTFSKLDLKEKPLNLEPFDPAFSIRQQLLRLKPAMERKNLRLTTAISFEQPFWGDPEALETSFSNLLENAVKYTPPGGSVKVEIVQVKEPGELELRVTNTFEPLQEQDLERIFEPFQRAETSGEAGFGLGLAIVKKIIEAHRGTIGAQNVVEGFRITMRLPAGREAPP